MVAVTPVETDYQVVVVEPLVVGMPVEFLTGLMI